MTVSRGKSPKLGENLLRRHFIQQESHMQSLENEIEFAQYAAGV
jgi:hypothetical protein